MTRCQTFLKICSALVSSVLGIFLNFMALLIVITLYTMLVKLPPTTLGGYIVFAWLFMMILAGVGGGVVMIKAAVEEATDLHKSWKTKN